MKDSLTELFEKIDRLEGALKAEASIEATKQLYLSDFFLFAKHCLGYKDLEWEVHKECVRVLESSAKRKLVVMPRGSFKSSLASVAYPIWRLLKDPNLTILLDSELYTNSKNLLREIKGHLASSKLINIFGNLEGPKWDEGEIILSTRTINRKEASITVGGIETTKVGQHYDCLHPYTKVFTSKGWVMAKDITAGSRVYTSSGKFNVVERVSAKYSSKDMIHIRPQYQVEASRVTSDHKIYVFRDMSAQWIEAGELKLTDQLIIPVPSGKTRCVSRTDDEINRLLGLPDIWRLIGYWLAEGCRTKTEANGIRLTFSSKEHDYVADVQEIVKNHLNVPSSATMTASNTCLVRFSHPQMKAILDKFGDSAANKRLPPLALNEDLDKKSQLILGYWRGDGCACGQTISLSSVSLSLLSGFQLLLAGMGIQSGITKTKSADFVRIKNQPIGQQRDAYSLSTTSHLMHLLLGRPAQFPKKPIRSEFVNGFWLVPIVSLEREPHDGFVFDLEVRGVHDFYLQGLIAHNCILGDDYNSASNSDTPEKCQKVLDHFKYNLNILNPGGEYVIVGTRYAELDVIGFLLSNVLEEKYLAEGKLLRGSPRSENKEEDSALLGG